MSRSTRVWVVVIVLVVLLVFVGPFVFGVLASIPSYEQPIPEFSHKLHTDAGIQCLYCHSGATRSPVSGIPSVAQCMGCHEHVKNTEDPIVTLREVYWEQGRTIPWIRVYQLPRYAHYPHNVHVNAGLNCEQCHGNVGEMDVVTPAQIPTMGWCIRCHQGEENAVELMECLLCHH